MKVKSYLISTLTRMTIFVLVMNFASCKVLDKNEPPEITSNPNKPLLLFLNCSLTYDSTQQEYSMNLVNKIISEGRIKDVGGNSKKYENDDFKYCLQDKNKQIISCTYFQNPLDRSFEYVNESGHLENKDIKLDSTLFSLRIQLTTDSKYVSFEKDKKQLLLVDLRVPSNIK